MELTKITLFVALFLFSASSFAQTKSVEYQKFKTFRAIKDTVKTFEPLQEIIDCGFKCLEDNPLLPESEAIINTLASNTRRGSYEVRSHVQFPFLWADYVDAELTKRLNNTNLSPEQKAVFLLVKLAVDLNHLPSDLTKDIKNIDPIRASFNNIYEIYPNLPFMIEYELRLENILLDFQTSDQLMKHRKMLTESKNERVRSYYLGLIKEMTEPFDLKFTAFDGRKVDISTMKGKVVLVDFWATWCGPCVAEIPHVAEVYANYRKKGFEVIGISCDGDRSRLEEFLKKNSLSWPQHFDGKGWENEFAKKYGVRSLPTVYLINRDGTIYSKNARGEALDKAMKELFK